MASFDSSISSGSRYSYPGTRIFLFIVARRNRLADYSHPEFMGVAFLCYGRSALSSRRSILSSASLMRLRGGFRQHIAKRHAGQCRVYIRVQRVNCRSAIRRNRNGCRHRCIYRPNRSAARLRIQILHGRQMITAAELSAALSIPPRRASMWAGPLDEAMAAYSINTSARAAAFIAQIGHESGRLVYVREIWGPTKQQRRYERDFKSMAGPRSSRLRTSPRSLVARPRASRLHRAA